MKKITKNIYLNKIIKFMKNDYPLFKNLKMYGFYDQLSEDELNYVFSGIFGEPVTIRGNSIYNQNGNQIYYENSDGFWIKREYDNNGNEIYYENSDGYWSKSEYDENGKQIYIKYSDGLSIKYTTPMKPFRIVYNLFFDHNH